MKKKTFHQDRLAMKKADKYNLTWEYKTARRQGLSPWEAMCEWDLWEMGTFPFGEEEKIEKKQIKNEQVIKLVQEESQ